MNNIQFSVSHQKLTLAGRPYLIGNSRDYLTASFQFSEDWAGLAKVVFFSKSQEKPYAFLLVDDAISADQHLNLSSGDWDVWMYGFAGVVEDISQLPTDVMRISTNKTHISVGINGASVGSVLEDEPASLGDQILLAAQNAVNTAYSVREDADNGRFNGKDGRDGRDGRDGEDGKPGDPGPRGPSGVYVGDTEPGGDAKVWICPGGQVSAPATQAWVETQLQSTKDAVQLVKTEVDALGMQVETSANKISAVDEQLQRKKNIIPTLSDSQKQQLRALSREYQNIHDRFVYHQIIGVQSQHSIAATRNDYAYAYDAGKGVRQPYLSYDTGKYKVQCSLFAQLVWMGRSADDFPSDITHYGPQITKAFDWGYYFNFPLRKRVYGMHVGDGQDTAYNGFVKPHLDSYEDSYSYTTSYTGAVDDPSGMGQTYTNFMGASEMARELYAMGCEIPYSELDVGDLVFFRTPSIADGKNDVSEWMAFRNINHVAMVSRIDANGNPVFIEAIEVDIPGLNSPFVVESIESSASAWQAPRCSALMRWAVMCARHPAAFGKGGNVPSEIDTIPAATEVSE